MLCLESPLPEALTLAVLAACRPWVCLWCPQELSWGCVLPAVLGVRPPHCTSNTNTNSGGCLPWVYPWCPQELGYARIWVFKETPFISWAGMYATSMILPSLVGRRAVHIVCWSDCYVQQLAVLLRLLATHHTPEAPEAGGGGNAGVGTPWGRLESFRVTMLDPHMLSTKRSDILSVKVWGAVRAALQKEGSELGVKVDFKVLFLEPSNLQVLNTVQPVEDEAVAVCCLMGLQRSSSCPEAGGGARLRIMEVLFRV